MQSAVESLVTIGQNRLSLVIFGYLWSLSLPLALMLHFSYLYSALLIVLSDGSLHIPTVTKLHATNYRCFLSGTPKTSALATIYLRSKYLSRRFSRWLSNKCPFSPAAVHESTVFLVCGPRVKRKLLFLYHRSGEEAG